MRELRLEHDDTILPAAPVLVADDGTVVPTETIELSLPRRDEPREVSDARSVIAVTTMMLDQHVAPEHPERPGMCRDLARAHAVLAAHYRREANL